jgi:hypothetical protein
MKIKETPKLGLFTHSKRASLSASILDNEGKGTICDILFIIDHLKR